MTEEQNESIISGKGDVENGIDRSGKTHKNGGMHNESETKIDSGKILQTRDRSDDKRSRIFRTFRGRSGSIEKSTIQRVVEKDNFQKISSTIAKYITWDINKVLYKKYKTDERWDLGYDFAEMITYDMLSDETNALRNLFSDEISEYFNGNDLTERNLRSIMNPQ